MVNKDILNYLKDGIKRGFSKDILKNELIKNNFNINEINEAINLLPKNTQPEKVPKTSVPPISNQLSEPIVQPIINQPLGKSPNNQSTLSSISSSQPKLGIFKKIGKAIAHPKELFNATEGEGVWSALKYWFVLSLIPLIISIIPIVIFSVQISTFLSAIPTLGILAGATFFLITTILTGIMIGILYIIMPILLFISIGIFHLFMKIFKGQGNFADTFRIGIYSMTPSYIFGFIPIINFVVLIWSFILSLVGFSIAHKISKIKVFLAFIIYLIIILVIGTGLIYLMILFELITVTTG